MRTIRCHVDAPLAVGTTLALPEETTTHLLRVLRLSVGDAVRLFNGDGHDYAARLLSAGKRGADVEVTARHAVATESPLRLVLAQGVARGEKMDLVLQKATELGVAAIVPLLTERTEVKLDGDRADKRLAHWRGVVASACEQCGRAVLPQVSAPLPLATWAAAGGHGAGLVLDPRGGVSLGEVPAPAAGKTLTLVAGPEGGLSERDLATLRAAGFTGLRLGPRVLRTETAGLAAIAALQARHGDLG